jgi:competence ComEA-like helix-hairpin-helix protein
MSNKEKITVTISEKELRGLTILLFILILVIVLPSLLYMPGKNEKKISLEIKKPSEEKERVDLAETAQISSPIRNFTPSNNWIPDTVFAGERDPKKWEKAGLSKKTARTLTKYLERGGRLEKPEDLLKIYGIDSTLWVTIKDWVQFPKTPPIDLTDNTSRYSRLPEKKEENREPKKTIPLIPLNQSDAEMWKQLPGIGPSYASRILKYRGKLGGFYKIEQLEEVYGLTDSLLQKIKPFLQVDTLLPSLPINVLNQAELSNHPYIDYSTAKIITAFIKQNGPISNVQELKKLYGLEENIIEKISPYLSY